MTSEQHIKYLESRVENLERENRQLREAWRALYRFLECRQGEGDEVRPIVTALEGVLDRVLGFED